jgi:hypothetical protein
MAPVLAVLWLALAAGSAWGYGYTNVNAPPGGEASHLEILTAIYGGNWTQNGVDFENDAGITVSRVYDFNGGDEIIHVLLGDETNVDQVWTDGTVTVTAEAKWAEFNQSFGWNGGGLGTTYNELLTDADVGGDSVTINISGDFLWGIRPTTGHPYDGYLWWSKQSLNENPYYGKDHMVTYFVEGLADLGVNEAAWLLFWEDYPCGGDEDFNDFVIEVRAIPEPSTVFLVAVGLVALGLRRRRT